MPNRESEVVTATPHRSEENSQELSILMQKVLGTDSAPDFTKEQVDELLSQKRETAGYIHADKKRESYDNKFYLVVICIFVIVFSALVLKYYPEVFSQVLSLVIGLFGGGAGGYAVAKSKG